MPGSILIWSVWSDVRQKLDGKHWGRWSIKICLLQIDPDPEVFCFRPPGLLTPAVDLAVTVGCSLLWPFSCAETVFFFFFVLHGSSCVCWYVSAQLPFKEDSSSSFFVHLWSFLKAFNLQLWLMEELFILFLFNLILSSKDVSSVWKFTLFLLGLKLNGGQTVQHLRC